MKQNRNIGTVFCLIAVAAFLLNSCATIFQGTRQDVGIDSGPRSADVWINGVHIGSTPCEIALKRNREYTIEIKKEGYQTKTYRITNDIGAGWVILDVIMGLVPVVVDAATGAWYSFDQSTINAVLEKQQ